MTLNSFDDKKARVYRLTTRFLYGTDKEQRGIEKELRALSKTDSEDLAFLCLSSSKEILTALTSITP